MTRPACLTGTVLILLASIAHAQPVTAVEATSGAVHARLSTLGGDGARLEISDGNGTTHAIDFPSLFPPRPDDTVVEISPSKSRVIVLQVTGRTATDVIFAGVRSGAVEAHFVCNSPSLSPDNRFLIARRFFRPNDPNWSDYYVSLATETPFAPPAILDLDDWPLPGAFAIYPGDTALHYAKTGVTWLTPTIFAFLDGRNDPDTADYEAILVAGELSPDATLVRFVAKKLDATLFAAANYTATTGFAPARALGGPELTRLDQPGLMVRMSFPYSAALRVRQADVKMW